MNQIGASEITHILSKTNHLSWEYDNHSLYKKLVKILITLFIDLITLSVI